ncbi:MAG: outer membrane beta-barrel protein [Hellea sp.]
MKSRLLIAAASAALMAAPSLASADDTEGWYLRGNAGYGAHTDMDLTGGIVSGQHGNGLQSEGNVAASLGLGYDFGNSWRLELDGSSLFTDFGSISQIPSTSAKLRTNTAMLNAIYDFDDFGRWEPYVGAGIGIVSGKLNATAHDFLAPLVVANPACPGTRSLVVNRDPGGQIQSESCDVSGKDSAIGYQLLAGLGYDISPNLKWDTHYRYLDSGKLDYTGARTNQVVGGSDIINVGASGVGAHSLMTGFRYLFGQQKVAAPEYVPPVATADYACWDGSMVFNAGQCPARPPAPQPTVSCWDGTLVFDASECSVQPQTYTCWDGSLVYDQAQCPLTESGNQMTELCGEGYRQEIIYYEFDKGQSAETRNTINRILDIGQYCNVDNIRVVGHTDTSGAASYNLNLSKRRAKDARDELVRQGIAGERITSEGKGETEPFVPTGDGVKEQLNRRTEVLISLGSVGVIN